VDIFHKFLETGHTQNEADSMHARIEIEAGIRELFSEEWKNLILSAKQEGENYEIFDLRNEDVLDFSEIVQRQNWKRAIDGHIVKWSKVREVTVEHQTGLVHVRYQLHSEDRVTIDPNSNLTQPIMNLQLLEVPKAYTKKFPLSSKKARDIRWLCREKAIPTMYEYHQFFTDILNVGAPQFENTDGALHNIQRGTQGEPASDEDATCSEEDDDSSSDDI